MAYATATSPLGPWKKQDEPIISRKLLGVNGTGHGDIFQTAEGEWYYVFHTHNSNTRVHNRKTAIIRLLFDGKAWKADVDSFRYLALPSADGE